MASVASVRPLSDASALSLAAGDPPQKIAAPVAFHVPLAPATRPMTRGPGGLVVPRPGVSPRQRLRTDDPEGQLKAEALQHFGGRRDDIIANIKEARPELDTASVSALADEWIARSVTRYLKLNKGYNDGFTDLTITGLLLAIAWENHRDAADPIRIAADATVADMRKGLEDAGLTPVDADFQMHTVGERLSNSTAGWYLK